MPGDTIEVVKQKSVATLVEALSQQLNVSNATAQVTQRDAQRLALQAQGALAILQSAAPRPQTARAPYSLLFIAPFFALGPVTGQQGLTTRTGLATIDAQGGLVVNSDVNNGYPDGVVLDPLFSEGQISFRVQHDTLRFAVQWGVQDAPGYRYAVWCDGSVVQAGWWRRNADSTINDVNRVASIAIPSDTFTVEIQVGPSYLNSQYVVRAWSDGEVRPTTPSAAIGLAGSAPLLPEGRIALGSLGGQARYLSLSIDDGGQNPGRVTSKLAVGPNWFDRFEASVPVLCTITSGAELRGVVSGSSGLGLLCAIPPGMTYRPIIAARWRVFGSGAAWPEYVRTQLSSSAAAGSLTRVDPVTGLDPSKQYEVQLVATIYENDPHWVNGTGLCVHSVILADGGTCSPWVNPYARWIEEDLDSTGAGVAMLPYPSSGPPSQPSNLIAEHNHLHVACDELGAIPVNWAFGGTGVLVPGSGGIPDARTNVFNYMRGRPRHDTGQPDVILMGHGTNDAGAVNRNPSVNISSAQFRAGYRQYLLQRRAFSPQSAIVCMRPVNGSFWQEIQDVAAEMGLPTIDTTGWLSAGDFTDGTHPTVAGQKKWGLSLAAALRTLFGADYWAHAGISSTVAAQALGSGSNTTTNSTNSSGGTTPPTTPAPLFSTDFGSYQSGTIDGQDSWRSRYGGTGTVTSGVLHVNAEVAAAAGGVTLEQAFAATTYTAAILGTSNPKFMLGWRFRASDGQRFAVWNANGNIEMGWVSGLAGAMSISGNVSGPDIPSGDYTVEIKELNGFPASGGTVEMRVWATGSSRPSAPSYTFAPSSPPQLPNGFVALNSIGNGDALYDSLKIEA